MHNDAKLIFVQNLSPALIQIVVTVFKKEVAILSILCNVLILLFIHQWTFYPLWLIYTVWIVVWKDLMTIFDAYYAKKPWKFGIKLMMISDAYCVSIEWRITIT